MSTRVLLLLVPVAAVLALTACSTGQFAESGGSAPAGAAPSAAASPSAHSSAPTKAAASPGGDVSTDGVCGLVPLASVNATLGRSYTVSMAVDIPDLSLSNASYCRYGTASLSEQFAIQKATSDPADAVNVFNEAAGNTLAAQSGIGDSAMFTASYPELVVVWGQTTIAVGQNNSSPGDPTITLAQLEKLATAVHAAG